MQQLFGEIHLPQQVKDELNAFGRRWPGADEVDSATWVRIHDVGNSALMQTLLRDLDSGEAAGIILALALNSNLILMDERDGRRAAERLGMSTIGTVGILVESKSKGYLQEVRSKLDGLRDIAGFYLSESLYQEVLRITSEQ